VLVLFGSLKIPKIHPFCIVLYFFGLKGLCDEKGFLEIPLRPFLDTLKLKRTELSLSLNSLKPNSNKLVHNRQERVSLSLGSLKHTDGFSRRANYRTSICYPPQA